MTDVTNDTSTETSESGSMQASSQPNVSSSTEFDVKALAPDDVKDDPVLESIKDVPSLIKSYVHSQRMLGNRIKIPSTEASVDEINEFNSKLQSIPGVIRIPDSEDPEAASKMAAVYDKLGRPKDPSGYDITVPEGLPVDTSYLEHMSTVAHKVGLTKSQMKALADEEIKLVQQQVEAQKARTEADVESLRKEWGNAFEANNKIASNLLGKFAEKYPEATKQLVESGMATNPLIRIVALELAKGYKESELMAMSEGTTGGRTPQEALDLIADIRSNKDHPYHDARKPGHKEAVEKVQRLYKDAYPDKKPS